ncbi:hypothetical protein [uncultured Muriicola sp.]|uniref:hypothetical protein n=1 Tax=uncultured Muriicola sp. TaxID=1583102 RepID=UPI00263551BA|nr:hypothetical protein [uncultured Muriicola sp.]
MKTVILYFKYALCSFIFTTSVQAQLAPHVYHGDEKDTNIHHEVKLNGDYFVHTTYETSPPNFISTIGGYYTSDADSLNIKLEFNSNFENDSIKVVHYGYEIKGETLVLKGAKELILKASPSRAQDLDGTWLFATRGPDTGQDRRGDSTPRKTLKFLMDGHFQWIAYHTETMRFSGTGGGSFTSKDGIYVENIEYFSRDNDRVGAVLDFNYELKGDDWHHTGKNSRGEPMYEIWARR